MSGVLEEVPSKVRGVHLDRGACVYVRQSTLQQVRENVQSTERQYGLVERAVELGWLRDQVDVVDEDLGCSGAQAAGRAGFQRLVARVSMGEVGAVFGLEVSRLARSSADWHRLLELCGLFKTLIVDEDGIYDVGDFNDRLVLGLKGTMSEAELHYLRSRMTAGKQAKARKGELRLPLPVGYVYDDAGEVVQDPDEEVREAVAGLFRTFRRTGSAYATMKALADQPFPKRAYGGAWAGQVLWGRLKHGRACSMLKNPTYAGVYAFGRFRRTKEVSEHGTLLSRTVELPMEEWEVLIRDHHPAYIEWEEYLENQRRLEKNRSTGPGGLSSGPAREGRALLQGLVVCGGCGRRLSVRYAGTGGIHPHYECYQGRREGRIARPACRSLRADVADEPVVRRVLEVLSPAHLELAARALEEIEVRREEERRRWRQRRERLDYEAARAQRQYEACEPENRLVARTLETRWNERLAELAQLETEWAERERAWARQDAPTRDQVLAIAQDLPRLWNAPSTSASDRKRILRTLVEDVTIRSDPDGPDVELGVRWRGGTHETLHVCRPPRTAQVRTPPDVVDAVRSLAQELHDQQIARELNAREMRTAKGGPFTRAVVRWIRRRHRIPAPATYRDGERSVQEIAAHFGVSANTVYDWIKHAELPASRAAPHAPWRIRLDPETDARLRASLVRPSRITTPTNPTPLAERSAL